MQLKDLRGHTILLAFWATWCTACELEIPTLETLQRDANQSAIVLGITDEDSSVVREWMDKYGRNFRSLIDGKATWDAFGVSGIPVLVVIDRNGIVRGYLQGIIPERSLRRVIAEVLVD